MHRFWDSYISKIVGAAAPKRMIEIGAEFGWNTEKLLQWCASHGAFLEVVDPAPHPVLHDVLARYPDRHRFHALKSFDALAVLPPAELVLLDGDHNWHTVYNEFQLMFSSAVRSKVPPPIVVMHDVAWPYARRDMYYDPAGIDPADRHPYALRGIRPDVSELVDDGLNGHFRNATHEGGLRNGVLTAIEDFRAAWPGETRFWRLPFFNGLGIVVPVERVTPALLAVVEGFFTPEALLAACERLERDGMAVRVELAAERQTLTRRSEALSRARSRILELEQEVAELRAARREAAATEAA